MWDWGRAITEAQKKMLKARAEGDEAKAMKFEEEVDALIAAHPSDKPYVSPLEQKVESLNQRLTRIEKRLGIG